MQPCMPNSTWDAVSEAHKHIHASATVPPCPAFALCGEVLRVLPGEASIEARLLCLQVTEER